MVEEDLQIAEKRRAAKGNQMAKQQKYDTVTAVTYEELFLNISQPAREYTLPELEANTKPGRKRNLENVNFHCNLGINRKSKGQ